MDLSVFLSSTNQTIPYFVNIESRVGSDNWTAVVSQGSLETRLQGQCEHTTQNRIEMIAALKVLAKLPKTSSVEISSRSQYLVSGMTRWIRVWERNGWKTANAEAVKNEDLWKALKEETAKRLVTWHLSDESVPSRESKPNSVVESFSIEEDQGTLMTLSEFLKNLNRDMAVNVWTDGSCLRNPGMGGWGVFMQQGFLICDMKGVDPDTTSNKMELTAACQALESLPPGTTVNLTTDSMYVKDGITSWIQNWKRNQWRTSAKTPVKNQGLWIRLDKAVQSHSITWNWTKGHAGCWQNERADRLAGSYANAETCF